MKTDKPGNIKRHGEVVILPPPQINCMQPLNRFSWCFTRGRIIVFGWLWNWEFSYNRFRVSQSAKNKLYD